MVIHRNPSKNQKPLKGKQKIESDNNKNNNSNNNNNKAQCKTSVQVAQIEGELTKKGVTITQSPKSGKKKYEIDGRSFQTVDGTKRYVNTKGALTDYRNSD